MDSTSNLDFVLSVPLSSSTTKLYLRESYVMILKPQSGWRLNSPALMENEFSLWKFSTSTFDLLAQFIRCTTKVDNAKVCGWRGHARFLENAVYSASANQTHEQVEIHHEKAGNSWVIVPQLRMRKAMIVPNPIVPATASDVADLLCQ